VEERGQPRVLWWQKKRGIVEAIVGAAEVGSFVGATSEDVIKLTRGGEWEKCG
jgi:hypothetical protein